MFLFGSRSKLCCKDWLFTIKVRKSPLDLRIDKPRTTDDG